MTILESVANLTKDNGAIKNLRDLLVMTNFQDVDLEKFFTFKQQVINGDKLGWIGEMDEIGWTGEGCNPEYVKPKIAAAEKTWNLGKWEAPLEWCYADFENTVAEYALKAGTDMGDLTSTDVMDYVIYPALKDAINRMFWRIIWFGDKNAANIAEGGQITAGMDVELFKVTDGLWKQLFATATANANQRVTIEANEETTYAAQMSKIKEPGVAIGIFDALLENADPRIATMEGAGLFVTKSLADALAKDVKREYKEILAWEQVTDGVKMTTYNGIPVYVISTWDRMIQKYQNNGTALNLPHRAFFGSAKNIFVGSPANEVISDLEIWFNQDQRATRVYSAGKLGTLLGEDNLFQIAY